MPSLIQPLNATGNSCCIYLNLQSNLILLENESLFVNTNPLKK